MVCPIEKYISTAKSTTDVTSLRFGLRNFHLSSKEAATLGASRELQKIGSLAPCCCTISSILYSLYVLHCSHYLYSHRIGQQAHGYGLHREPCFSTYYLLTSGTLIPGNDIIFIQSNLSLIYFISFCMTLTGIDGLIITISYIVATHPLIWLAISSLLKLLSALFLYRGNLNQYIGTVCISYSSIPSMPLICPSILLKPFIRLLYYNMRTLSVASEISKYLFSSHASSNSLSIYNKIYVDIYPLSYKSRMTNYNTYVFPALTQKCTTLIWVRGAYHISLGHHARGCFNALIR